MPVPSPVQFHPLSPLRHLSIFFPLLALLLFLACGPGGTEKPPQPSGKAPASRPASRAGSATKPEERWAFDWRRWRQPEQILRIDAGGLVMGPAGGALRRLLFVEPERTRDVLYFSRTYGPFTLRAGDGVLAFRGRGLVRPGPGEQRMLYEWARQVAAEAGGMEPGAGYGLVFAWQRFAGDACDEVSVYLCGEVRAGRCGERGPIAGRLAPAPLGWLYDRFDRLRSFQIAAESGGVGLTPRLVFTGRGTAEAGPEERQDLADFAAQLGREVAARHGPPAAAQAAPEDVAKKGKEPPKRPDAAPVLQRLLLPPERLGPLPEVILPDDRLPPPPPVPVKRDHL
jgi:hypothetical protein